MLSKKDETLIYLMSAVFGIGAFVFIAFSFFLIPYVYWDWHYEVPGFIVRYAYWLHIRLDLVGFSLESVLVLTFFLFGIILAYLAKLMTSKLNTDHWTEVPIYKRVGATKDEEAKPLNIRHFALYIFLGILVSFIVVLLIEEYIGNVNWW